MSQSSERRVLTSAVVRPSEDVSPATLLHALISLCHAICVYQSATFGSCRRAAREAIREVRILLPFLEEIRERRPKLSTSFGLSFAELYIVLQKVRCLLEDCSREGARVWVLVNADRVVGEFRVLIRSLATALDVLPLASINLTTEVRELAELLRDQAWRVRIVVDAGDESARRGILSTLALFENRATPNLEVVKRVLEHLEIRSWSDCNKEIRFLEEEIEYENSKAEKKETGLLSSLLGLMTYCRVVVLGVLDSRSSDRSEGKCETEVINYLNLDDFRCPISLDFMVDPVTVATGQTYDRASIEKWFAAGNSICPKTREKLINTELIPNSALRKLIHQFLNENGISVTGLGNRSREMGKTTITADSPAAVEATRMLAVFLVEKLATGSEKEKSKAAFEVRLLTKFSTFNRACLVEAGSILWLLNLLASSDPLTQENSTAALLNLSKHPKGKIVIIETGGLEAVLDVLCNGLKIEARQNAAAVLFYLSSVDEYREIIGKIPETFPALVALLKHGGARGKKNSVVALYGLSIFPGNRPSILASGAVPALINLLPSGRDDLGDDAIAVLAALAERPEGTAEILKASAVRLLVRTLQSTSSRVGKEHCVSTLLSLCINDGSAVVPILRDMPSMMVSLYSLLTDGTDRASKKASSLLSILHDWPSPRAMVTPAMSRDRAVHVR